MQATQTCKNCETSFDTTFAYCPHCGQEAADNLTFGLLFSNTISNYFSIDARFFKSFVPLLFKPGVLARRFVDGKRLKYLHPAQFYLFISVVFFFLFSFSVRDADNKVSDAIKKDFGRKIIPDSIQSKIDSTDFQKAKKTLIDKKLLSGLSDEDMKVLDSVIVMPQIGDKGFLNFDMKGNLDSLIEVGAPEAERLKAMGMKEDAGTFTKKLYVQGLKIYEQQGGGILNTLYDAVPIAMFFMLPLFAVLLKIFYWRRGTFAHHMVFSFYFFTFLFTVFTLLILANLIIDVPLALETLVFFSFVLYLLLALRNFYRSSWFGAFLKACTIAFVYLAFIVPIAIFGVIFASFILY